MARIKTGLSWPIGIGIFYGSFVLSLLGFLIFTIFTQDDLESTDYYSRELAHQEQIDRQQNAQNRGYILNWHVNKKSKSLIIQFPDDLEFSKINGRITLFRPSNSNMDRVFPIKINQNGTQIIQTHDLDSGNWRLKILWRNAEGEYYQDGQIILP